MDTCMIDQLIDEQNNLSKDVMDSQEVQLYDYLVMKFTIKALDQKQHVFHAKKSQFTQIIYHQIHRRKSAHILELFVNQEVQNKKGKSNFKQNEENQQQSFLKKLIQRYPSVFKLILSEQKITWEDILLNVIKRGSLTEIFKFCNSISSEFDIENSLLLIKPTINLYFESLFYDKTFKSLNLRELQQLKYIITVDFHNFFKKTELLSIESSQKVIEKVKLALCEQLERHFHKLEQNQFESVTFYKDYQKFKEIYEVEEIQKNQKIFELHYIETLLQNSESIQQEFKCFSFPVTQQFQVKVINSLIHTNFLNVKNDQKVQVNKNLLRSFMDAPYQTSLFVFYKFFESSEIKDTKKFFDNSKPTKFIDPLMWLFIKKELINVLNIEAVSISLWIMTDVWLKFIEEKTIQRVKLSKESLLQTQKTSKLRDPRKIYAINQQAYTLVQTPMSGSIEKPLISSMEQFENTYKRPLMHTMIMWLLSLNVESTMLKYFCIENDLLKQMSQGDILPTLLSKNQYIFNNEGTVKRFEHSKTLEQELKTKIMNAKNVKELEQLEQQYLKSTMNEKFIRSKNQQQFSCFQPQPQQPLPWLQIIESKQFLFPLLNKPSGYELILKLIQKNPRSYIKLYESYLFKMICSEIQKKNYEEMVQNKNRSDDVQYKFQGNKNAKPKKTISYGLQYMKQSSVKRHNLEKAKHEKQRKFDAIKKIVLLFKSNTKDENLKLTCNQMLKYL